MMYFNKISLLTALLLLTHWLTAQNGFIRGTVYDDGTGESLPGVTVLLEGTTTGTMTDFDGKFNIKVPPGHYTVRFSFISYETLFVRDLMVKENEVSLLDNIRLKEVTLELSEVVITADMLRNSETALLTMKHRSANVIDGISAAGFRRMGDSDAASSMKRVTGVSVEGGKYVYVRGLGDRYTKTTLNGMDIPGLDPDRNTLQMDLFPTSVIDNILVIKSFTADLPADFTGGVVDISTRDFPEERTADLSVSIGINPSMHFNPDYLYYEGGKKDFLGYDDGTRRIPATENIPLFTEVVGDPYGEKGIRYHEILEGFNPTLSASVKKSLMDYSLGASFGNQTTGGKLTWGYNAAISYKSTSEYYQQAEYGRYGLSGDPDVMEMDMREYQTGNFGVKGVLWGALAGVAMKSQHSKIRLNITHLQNGESKAGIFDYSNADQGSYFEGIQHNLEYSQRSLTNLILNGKHFFRDNAWQFEWKISPTLSRIEDPDIRFTRYEIRGENYQIGTESGFPERIWRDLDEYNLAGIVYAEKNFTVLGEKASIRFGGSATYKSRDYVIRNYQLNIRNIPLTGNPDELFYSENLWPYQGSATRGTTFEAPFIPVNPNQFDANNMNTGLFVSMELTPMNRLKAILGLRSEKFTQHYTGQDQLGYNILDNTRVIDDLGFFPSANLIYSINDQQNLRLSYSKTIARPSFKELSYAEIFDPITGRVFIGGLFRDADDVSGIVYWEGNLESTGIHNADLRWEWLGERGQTFSLGAFYKYFIHPIEIVQYATQVGAFQPRNVGDGQVTGAELEVRHNLGFISGAMDNLSFLANVTWTYSQIKLSRTEYESRLANARTGQKVTDHRSMAGQAPFIVNAGITYHGDEKGFLKGFEAGLFHNVQGRTLEIVGIVDRPDIYTVPFHSLNFNMNQLVGKEKRIRIGLKIDNILGDKKESVFSSYHTKDQYYTRLHQGTAIQLHAGFNLF